MTKDGNDTSLLVTAGPDVAVNLILGLPFITATGMIVDFIDNMCDAKHLICDPFPIDFFVERQNPFQLLVIAMQGPILSNSRRFSAPLSL